jgi:hypothetical protein
MSMTKTDYELVASAIEFSHQSLNDNQFNKLYDGIERTAETIADYLQADNPKFNRNKFLEACGIQE